jgi:prephenate dehydratase
MLLYFSVQTDGHSSGPVRTCELSQDVKNPHNSVVFSLKNQVGGLARALQVFQVRKIHIY